MLTPLKPTGFDFSLCFTVLFACFAFKSSQHLFIHLKTLDVWCFMCRYNDIFYYVFAAFSTTVSCSQQRRVSIQTWTECARRSGQTSFLSCYMNFYHVFVPSCDTWTFWFCTLSDLADILFDDQYCKYGRYVFVFSLLCSFCLLFHYCSGSILWMTCGS